MSGCTVADPGQYFSCIARVLLVAVASESICQVWNASFLLIKRSGYCNIQKIHYTLKIDLWRPRKDLRSTDIPTDTVFSAHCFFLRDTWVELGSLQSQIATNPIHPTTVTQMPPIHTQPPLISQLRGYSSWAKCRTVTSSLTSMLVKNGRL